MVIFVFWKSKKQTIIVRSSAEAGYRVVAHTTTELTSLPHFFQEINLSPSTPIPIFCDNRVVLHIVSNLVFHEKIKHIEVDSGQNIEWRYMYTIYEDR